MIILLDDSVFALPDAACRRRLISLVEVAQRRKHLVQHADGDLGQSGSLSALAFGSDTLLPIADRDWLEDSLKTGFAWAQRPNAPRRSVRVHDGPSNWTTTPPTLSLDDGAKYVQQPVELLVEDDETEGSFLDIWAPAARAAEFRDALVNGSLKVMNGGGISGLTRRVKQSAARVDRKSLLHRTIALFDSDAAEPGTVSPEANICANECRSALGLQQKRFHQLKRRAIENYLPFSVLTAYAADPTGKSVHVDAISSLRSLGQSSPHFWHYHVKRGLIADLSDQKRRKLYEKTASLPWDASDVVLLPPHWQSGLSIAIDGLLRGFGTKVTAWCINEMTGHAHYAFDTDAELEAEEVFAMILSWV